MGEKVLLTCVFSCQLQFTSKLEEAEEKDEFDLMCDNKDLNR